MFRLLFPVMVPDLQSVKFVTDDVIAVIIVLLAVSAQLILGLMRTAVVGRHRNKAGCLPGYLLHFVGNFLMTSEGV